MRGVLHCLDKLSVVFPERILMAAMQRSLQASVGSGPSTAPLALPLRLQPLRAPQAGAGRRQRCIVPIAQPSARLGERLARLCVGVELAGSDAALEPAELDQNQVEVPDPVHEEERVQFNWWVRCSPCGSTAPAGWSHTVSVTRSPCTGSRTGTRSSPSAFWTTASPPSKRRGCCNHVPLCKSKDTGRLTPTTLQLLGMDLVIWPDQQGEWRAAKDQCPHRWAPLPGRALARGSAAGRLTRRRCRLAAMSEGWLEQGVLQCRWARCTALGTAASARCQAQLLASAGSACAKPLAPPGTMAGATTGRASASPAPRPTKSWRRTSWAATGCPSPPSPPRRAPGPRARLKQDRRQPLLHELLQGLLACRARLDVGSAVAAQPLQTRCLMACVLCRGWQGCCGCGPPAAPRTGLRARPTRRLWTRSWWTLPGRGPRPSGASWRSPSASPALSRTRWTPGLALCCPPPRPGTWRGR